MQRGLLVMAALAMFAFGSATSATASDEQGQSGEKSRLKVSGMHCGACEKTVEKAAKKVDGVIVARASQPDGAAEITYDPAKTNPEAIAKAITEQTPFKAEAPKREQPKR